MRSVFGLVGSFAVLVFLATPAWAEERVEFLLTFTTEATEDCLLGVSSTFHGANLFTSYVCVGTVIDPAGTLSGTYVDTGVVHTNFVTFSGESHSTFVQYLPDGSELIWRYESTFTLDPNTFETLSVSGQQRLLSAEGPAGSFGDEVISANASFIGDGFGLTSEIDGHYIH